MHAFRLAVSLMLGLFAGSALAQDAANDQADVWAAVESVWNAEKDGDRRWIERMLTEDFSGWSRGAPAPRNKASTAMWDRFMDEQGKLVAHELYPLAIIVRGDTAVAHYLYSSAWESKDGELELNNGRYTDVLVRTEDGWRFIAWHGGDDPGSD